MSILARGINLPNVVAVQCSHDANAREHRRSARRRHQDQGFHRRLPLRGLMFGLRKSRDVFAGILERDELTTARQRYWIIKPSLPAAISHQRASQVASARADQS